MGLFPTQPQLPSVIESPMYKIFLPPAKRTGTHINETTVHANKCLIESFIVRLLLRLFDLLIRCEIIQKTWPMLG